MAESVDATDLKSVGINSCMSSSLILTIKLSESMMSEINIMLNKLGIYKDKTCTRCGRKHPDTLLNIEGCIHHGCKLLCLDKKSCEKFNKKNGKAKTKYPM